MNRIFLLFIAAFGLLAPPAPAQGAKAAGKLYTRTVGDEFQAAIVIKIDRGFHLYHKELGGKNATGKPLTVEFEAEGVKMDPLEWPEPHSEEQEDFMDGGMTYILYHEKKITIYGHGKVTGGEITPTVSLNGLTCESGGSCFPYSETLSSKGEGSASVWANYPADAWAPAELGSVEEPVVKDAEESGMESQDEGFGVTSFGISALDGGDDRKAHAKLIARTEGDKVELGILIDIEEDWHLFHKDLGGENATGRPLIVTLEGEGVEFGELSWQEPHEYDQEDFMDGGMTYILGHENSLMIYGTATLGAGASTDSISVELDGQTCEEGGVCLLYSQTLKVSDAGEDAVWSKLSSLAATTGAGAIEGEVGQVPEDHDEDESSPEDSEEDEEDEEDEEGLKALILAAIGGGIFALLMPCTYPMIPITISFFTKQAESRGGKVWPLSLTYGCGIVLIFILIGVVVGPVVLEWATHPVTNVVLGTVFVIFAAALFGAITLNPPAALMNMAGKASMKGGFIGVFLMGTTLVLTSFTCTAPFVGSLLSLAVTSGGADMSRVVIGMGVFGLTMAVPFTLLSLLPGKVQSLPSSGEWMDTLKVSLGFIELAAAMKFFSNAELVWEMEILSKELFLLIWAIIFVIGGIYLMGWIHVKGHSSAEIGAGRMLGALSFLLFGAYCFHGYNGHSLSGTMTAIVPAYSSAPKVQYAGPSGGGGHGLESIIEDDHALAIKRALDEDKSLLLNFTGVT
jgi:thiol:disulfide interchange protein